MNALLRKMDFGNEAGDDVTAEEITHFFVEQDSFREFLDAKKNLLMATAEKGVGKSALLKWMENEIPNSVDENALVISVKGNDLVRSAFGLIDPLTLPNEYIRDWTIRLCALINRKIGAELSLAFSDDKMTMVEAAEIDGFKRNNILTALTSRLTKLLPGYLAAKKLKPSNEIELLKRYQGRSVWILVDDLDATYQHTERENLELAAFFSASRNLTSLAKGLNIRVTMRTDVWPLVRRFDEALDKCVQYVRNITWSQKDFRKLLAKRIEFQMTELGIKDTLPPAHVTETEIEEHLINKIFEKRMPWGANSEERRTYSVIYTLSYCRPRWAIQLCKLAQTDAIEKKDILIHKAHIDEVWGPYGRARIADLIAEHKHQCSQVEELIVAFRGSDRRLTREELLRWIKNRISAHMTPIIEGKAAKAQIDVAHFLYRIGFIVARVDDAANPDHYEHYHFSDMPDFLSSRTNQDFGAIWEIHPCYREALDIKKLNAEQRKRRNLGR